MPASDDDREMMARFNDTFRKLKTNREQVPLEVLQTKYASRATCSQKLPLVCLQQME